jgi:hypothetical protein
MRRTLCARFAASLLSSICLRCAPSFITWRNCDTQQGTQMDTALHTAIGLEGIRQVRLISKGMNESLAIWQDVNKLANHSESGDSRCKVGRR